MGGDARDLILPVPIGPRGVSSWAQHQRRDPRSSEPGTDIYCDTGTEVVAPADGVIYEYGDSVMPATGRWVGIDFDNGKSFRCMHHSRIIRKSGRVRQGDVIALSGSSGYGSEFFGEPYRNSAFWWNTGGDHSHVTLWPDRNKRYGYGRDGDPKKPYTIDIMDFIRPNEPEDWLMALSDEEAKELLSKTREVYNAMFNGGQSMNDSGRSVAFSLGNLTEFADRIDRNVGPIMRDGKLISLRQEIADTKTGVLALLGRPVAEAEVDEEKLAAALAPMLVDNLGTLSDGTVDEFVKRLLDEQARRLAS